MTIEKHGKTTACPYCRSTCRAYVRYGGKDYLRCDDCDLIFKNRRGDENTKDLRRYYENHYFDDYARDELAGYRESIYCHVMDSIEREKPSGSLLDVGCGCGLMLKEAQSRGWQIMGVDPSMKSLDHAEALVGRRLFRGMLSDFPVAQTYDVITFINVLDHSASPWSDIHCAGQLLKKGGLIFIRCPNGLFHASMRKISWRFMSKTLTMKYLVLHEYAFTPSFMRRLLSDRGFSGIDIRNAGLSGGAFFSRTLKKIIAIAANSLLHASTGRMIVGPSLEVMARR